MFSETKLQTCVPAGYGDGTAGYLGAAPGNGFGERQLMRRCRDLFADPVKLYLQAFSGILVF